MTKQMRYAAVLVSLGTLILGVSAAAGADTKPASPLAGWVGFGHDAEQDQATFDEEFAQREQLKTACMAKLDLDYVPRTLVVHKGANDIVVEDPNREYVESLSELEQKRFWVSLTGQEDPDSLSEDLDVNRDGKVDYRESFGEGCAGDAHRELLGVFAAKAILTEEYNDLRLDARADLRVKAIETEWVACMNGLGFDGKSRTGVFENLEGTEDIESDRLAKARNECDSAYSAVLSTVVIELETRFVETHKDVLDEFGIRK